MWTLEDFCKKHEGALFICVLFIFLVNTLPGINKFLLLDEVLYLRPSEAVLKTGFPLYEYDHFTPQHVALWHPPGIFFFYALSFALLGVSEYSARLVPLLFSIGTIVVIYLTCKRIFRNSQNQVRIGLLSIFLYAINPFVVQSALLVDIDGGILTFFMTLFIYLFVSIKDKIRLPLLVLVFTTAMFTKLMSPLLGLAGIFVASLHMRDRRGVRESVVIGSISIFLTLSLLYLYTWFFDKPEYFLLPLRHSLDSTKVFTNPTYLLQVLATIQSLFLYVTPPFALLALLGFKHAIFPVSNWKSNKLLFFCIAWSVPVLLSYIILGRTSHFFPKYFTPAMPVVVILVSNYLNSLKIALDRKLIVAITITTLIYSIFVIRTPHFEIFKSNLLMNAFYPVLYSLIIPLGYLLLYRSKLPTLQRVAYVSFFVLIPLSLYINFVLTTSNFSSAYLYGTTGVKETGLFLKENTQPNDILLAPEDVIYYAKRHYYIFVRFDENHPAELRDIIRNKKARYITTHQYFLDRQTEELILASYKYERTIGSFPIYSPK